MKMRAKFAAGGESAKQAIRYDFNRAFLYG